MAENVAVKKASEQIDSCWPGYGQFRSQSLFGPMIPFGDLFGVNSFSLRKEFEKEMDRAFSTPLGEGFELQAWAPSVEVKEVNGDLMVTAELPGIRIEDVKVAVTDDNLTIEDERKHETKEEEQGVYHSERSYGRFYRSIVLPEGAKTDQIKAEMNNGILQIKVPLAENKQKSRQIPVSVAEGAKEQKTTGA